MKARVIALKVLFLVILAILFALIGYLAYPYIYKSVIGADLAQVISSGVTQGPTNQNGMAFWGAALGLAIGTGTLLCSVESSKKQALFYFIFLLVLALGFTGIWILVMQGNFSLLIEGATQDVTLNAMDYASFYEIPQFASAVILVLSLIVFVKKTKDH